MRELLLDLLGMWTVLVFGLGLGWIGGCHTAWRAERILRRTASERTARRIGACPGAANENRPDPERGRLPR